MKKLMVVASLLVVALVTLGVAGFAYAQSQTPPAPQGTPAPVGPGSRMGGWMRGGMMGSTSTSGTYIPEMMGRGRSGARGGMMGSGSDAPMHEYMIHALAEGLNLTSADLQAQITAGKTPYQIAQDKGLSDDQIKELFLKAHDKALDAAVKAGLLTQEQADWMDQRMAQRWENGFPGFGAAGLGGMPCQGAGGWNAQPTTPAN